MLKWHITDRVLPSVLLCGGVSGGLHHNVAAKQKPKLSTSHKPEQKPFCLLRIGS